MSSSPAVTRNSASRKSSSSSFTLLDIKKLISESEERIISHVNQKFDELSSKIDALETAVTQVKAVQVQQEADINRIKDLIAAQQHQIEMCQEKERECNLMLSNIPETDVIVNGERMQDDESKVLNLLNLILPPDDALPPDHSQHLRQRLQHP